MRSRLIAASTTLACLVAHAAQAQPGADDAAAEADHQGLRELKAVFEQAASENNLDLLRPYVNDAFSAVTYTDREFTDFEAFKARWQKTRDEIVGTGSYKVTLLPERSELYGDFAICRGDSDNVLVNSEGKEFKFTSHWTAVCRKVDGQWKILRAHSSLDPFGNPMLVDGVTSRIVQTAAMAALGGILVGGIAGNIVARRRSTATAPRPAA
jgi:ketosteroid isomerase-like protein